MRLSHARDFASHAFRGSSSPKHCHMQINTNTSLDNDEYGDTTEAFGCFLFLASVRYACSSAEQQPWTASSPAARLQTTDNDYTADLTTTSDITTSGVQDIYEEAQSDSKLVCSASTCHLHWQTLWIILERGGNRRKGIGGGCQDMESRERACNC